MFKRIVNAVEIAALAAAMLFVVLMVAYRPAKPGAVKTTSAVANDVGASVFVANCAGCHGSRGLGGLGPKLAGGAVVARFPDVQTQIALVTNGKGSMPAWGSRLSAAEIEAVVDYTRNRL